MANPKIEVEIGGSLSKLQKALQDAQAQLQAFGNKVSDNLSGLSKAITDVDGKFQQFGTKATALGKGLSLAVTAPILALGAASIKSASDTQEAFSKFDTVFRDVAKSAEQSFKTLRNEYGLSSLEAKSLLADTGDLLTGFGFTQNSALELATEVNKLAVDLASFTNFSGGAEGASNALTSALLGEREAVKSLGISILEEDVKKRVAINTAKGLTFETERQAKAYATLQIAQEQSKNALGDYSRTSDGFANQTRLLTSRLSDLSAELGEILLPLATKITSGITGLINGFTGLSDTTKTTIVVVGGLLAAIGPVSLLIGGIITSLPLLITGFAALKTAIIAATGPFGLIAIAVAAAIPLLFELNTELERTKNIKTDVAQDLLAKKIVATNEALADQLKRIKEIFPELSKEEQIRKVLKNELEGLNKLGDTTSESYKKQKNAILDWGLAALEGAKGGEALANSLGLIGGLTDQINKLNEQRDLAKDQTEVNLITAKVTALQDQLALINAIAKRASEPVKSKVGVLAPRDNPFADSKASKAAVTQGVQTGPTAQMKASTEAGKKAIDAYYAEIRAYAAQFSGELQQILEGGITNTFANLGASIGEAIATGANVFEAAGKSLLRSLGSFLGELGYMMIQYGTMAIVKAKLDASLLVPGAGFVTGPLAIAAGVALVALSSAIGAKASGGGGGGGGSVGGGVASQSFTGGGVGGLGGASRELTGELVVRGNDLVYVLGQSQNKITKG